MGLNRKRADGDLFFVECPKIFGHMPFFYISRVCSTFSRFQMSLRGSYDRLEDHKPEKFSHMPGKRGLHLPFYRFCARFLHFERFDHLETLAYGVGWSGVGSMGFALLLGLGLSLTGLGCSGYSMHINKQYFGIFISSYVARL